ncbi:MAG: NAD(P)/FAD-dependent oxidoreductase [Phycisphaerales bacterium]|nr:NAD(P)/FAD-dependent oxidoreductase [Phycisphaerales bacterium]
MVVGEFTQEANLVVIGSGPGGYSAAFRAAELGIQTIIVDSRKDLGGICLHAGCVPSKTLLHIAEIIGLGRRAAAFGVEYGQPRIDLEMVRAWVHQSTDRLSSGLASRAKKLGVEVIAGRASFDDGKNLSIHGGSIPRLKFRKAIVAVGARPAGHPLMTFDERIVINPWQALQIESIPESLLVLGGAAQAIELAMIYAALGSKVTLAATEAQILPAGDVDIVRPLHRALVENLNSVLLGATVTSASIGASSAQVGVETKEGQRQLEFDRVIIAVGQTGNTRDLGLDRTKVECDSAGFITVDGQMRTSESRILAVGDVTGPPWSADRALAQGRVAAEVVAGWNSGFDSLAAPRVLFTDPNVAWCGLTESQANEQGVPHKVAKIPWGASGRAVGMNRVDGLTKLIYDPDTKIVLGVGIVGAGAAEMIGEGALAVEMGVELDDLAGTVHPHPSMCELLSDAAR